MSQAKAVDNEVDLSVILVSYNTATLLPKAIAALRDASRNLHVQTIIVDNASRDDSVKLIRNDFPECELIINTVNVGFGRANNQALPLAAGRYVLLLNTDAFVSLDTLDKTVAYMDTHRECGILGVKLTGPDGALQPSARYFPTPWNLFLNLTGFNRIFSKTRLVDDLHWDHASIRHCDWVPGCYYLVRKAVIDEVGLFDPRYFLYYEEVDHCYATKQAGWFVVFYPGTTVVHLGGESAKSDVEFTESGRQIESLQVESELLYFRKHRGIAGVLTSALLTSLGYTIVALKCMFKRRAVPRIAAYLRHIGLVWYLLLLTKCGTRPTR